MHLPGVSMSAPSLTFVVLLVLIGGTPAAATATTAAQSTCGWYLEPNDCICMNSTNGGLLPDETSACCRNEGMTTVDSVRS
ncbi:hypothetical protein SPI_04355 [Niveomyces insectorum RCEF 264]|uniref:Extracellular membrane protein CFEM domain-containing protein n=1 Tax=Niveomyces insectorum RCEF 264 TaxID=1081102 RepID=A0A167VNG2_9HYPO|nr:hypothetical protein SPI_04355 [Niveomyces insectorum RCEF 264]